VSRLPGLRPSSLNGEQEALYSSITEGPRARGPQHFALTAPDGSLNGPFNAFLYSPVLGNAIQELGAAVRYSTTLTDRTREMAILIVAARWDSGFERHAHESVGRAVGLTEDEIAELSAGRLPVLEDDHERACAELTFALAHGDVGDAEWTRLHPILGDPTAFELSTLVGYYAMLGLQLRAFRVEVF
jgi:4-carboxymuconolactone decarboxylase